MNMDFAEPPAADGADFSEPQMAQMAQMARMGRSKITAHSGSEFYPRNLRNLRSFPLRHPRCQP